MEPVFVSFSSLSKKGMTESGFLEILFKIGGCQKLNFSRKKKGKVQASIFFIIVAFNVLLGVFAAHKDFGAVSQKG